MQIPMDITTVLQSLGAFAYNPATPKELAQRLQTAPGSAVDKVFGGVELLYAFRDQVGTDGLTLLGQLSGFGVQHGWLVPTEPTRLQGIFDGCRRDLGEAGSFGAAADDPVPNTALREDGKDWRGELAPDLNQLKKVKREAVQVIRNDKEQGTCQTPEGVLQINDASKIKIDGKTLRAQMAKASGAAFSVGWIMADNSVAVLDADQMIAMGEAVDDYVTALYAHSLQLFGEIAAVAAAPVDPSITDPAAIADAEKANLAAAVAALDAIDIQAGWPE